MSLLVILLCLLSYSIYHYNFFKYLDIMINNSKNKYKVYIVYFLFNYLIFIICTYLRLHLVINWTIFMLILFMQIKVTYKLSTIKNLFYSLNCSIIGLAINIFFRSLMSIVLNMPAYLFDSNSITNIYRVFSILLSFIVTGLYFSYKNHKNKRINKDSLKTHKNNTHIKINAYFNFSHISSLFNFLSFSLKSILFFKFPYKVLSNVPQNKSFSKPFYSLIILRKHQSTLVFPRYYFSFKTFYYIKICFIDLFCLKAKPYY